MGKYLPNHGVNCFGNVFTEHESLPRNDTIQISDSPETLYRVIPLQYFNDFLLHGKFRIHPLSNNRFNVPVGRADPWEGRALQALDGINNIVRWISTDSFCLSFSMLPLATLKSKFDGKYVKIINVEQFLIRLDSVVRSAIKRAGHSVNSSVASSVAYCDFPGFSFGEYGCALHQAFVKPHINQENGNPYWIENEYRVVWDVGTTHGKLNVIPIERNEFCEHLSILDDSELNGDDAIKSLRVRAYTADDHRLWIAKNKQLK